MTKLSLSRCEACNKNTPALTAAEIETYRMQISGWSVLRAPDVGGGNFIVKRWKFKDWDEAFALVKAINSITKMEDHHPEVRFGWGFAEVTLSTHAIRGLSRNDFIVAAKIDEIQP